MTLIKNNLPTYVTLGKDANLKYLGHGQYDRDYQSGDFVQVKDVDSLHNAIRIKLMTIYGEMIGNPSYQYFGNLAWGLLKANKTPINIIKIKEDYTKALDEMRRIKTVDNIVITTDDVDPLKLNVTYMVTTITDQTITGGVVLS